ncbi:kynureninase [Halobacteriales archaeon QH_2_66_30]|nr:MAG: kynureninase [Halobacteriales archaeon QH_2_66_30]
MDGDLARTHDLGEAYARERDAADPLADFADRFHLPDELYLDGNSLGPVSDAAEQHVDAMLSAWREYGIRGWTESDPPWFTYGESLGDDLAPLLGAAGEECIVTGTTTVNIHTLIGTFLDTLDADDDRGVLVNEVVAAMDEREVGIVFMPSVLFRSGQLLDVEAITEAAHERDVLAGFDLAHSVGVVPHELSAHGVDFAVWCSYKYLNAGPGAVAGLYVNERHFGTMPALAGWWGHDKETQFDLNLTFTPAEDAGAWQISAVPMLSTAPLAGSLELVHEAGIDRIREKSLELTSYLMTLVDERLAERGCTVGTPRVPERRGGHVAIEHPDAYRLSQALRDRGAIVDFREPNVIRVCPAPLYVGFREVRAFVDLLADLIDERTYEAYDTERGDIT